MNQPMNKSFVVIFLGVVTTLIAVTLLLSPKNTISISNSASSSLGLVLPAAIDNQPSSPTVTINVSPAPSDTITFKPQFVLLSFDGSKDIKMWQATRDFATSLNRKNIPIHFTYFISSLYFIPEENALLYRPPKFPIGASKIGYSNSKVSIPLRLDQVSLAIAEGHEIGSHLNGHFAGGGIWNQADWLSEIDQFYSLLNQSASLSGIPSANFPGIDKIKGIRAPNLSKNNSFYTALNLKSYTYDTSVVAKIDAEPYKIGNLWEVPLKNIPLSGTKDTIISMDYNFWSRQTGAEDKVKKDTQEYSKLKEQVVSSYLNYFQSQYRGSRSPVVIGHHFSLWNDGLYFDAIKDFATQVCGLPEVRCVTFSEYVNYLNSIHPL